MNLRVHFNFFPRHNHFVWKVMQLDTYYGVQSQPAGVQDGVTGKNIKISFKIDIKGILKAHGEDVFSPVVYP